MDKIYVELFERYKTLKESILKEVVENEKNYKIKSYCFTSANLKNFFPSISLNKHYDVYKDILLTRGMTNTESKYFGVYDAVPLNIDNNSFNDYKNDSRIFCTFHLGSYRSIIGILAKQGLDLALLVDSLTYRNQSNEITELVNNIRKHYKCNGSFEILEAEKPDIGLTLTKFLKNNVNLIVYIDGNTGTGGIFNKNIDLIDLNFLNKELIVRKGIAYLSYFTKKKIVPVISYYDEFENKPPIIQFMEEISPIEHKDKALYIKKTVFHLWGILEKHIQKYPNQWEGWLYIHKYLKKLRYSESKEENIINTDTIDPSNILIFNSDDYEIFKIEEDNYLLNKDDYNIYEIPEDFFYFLNKLKKFNFTFKELAKNYSRNYIDGLINKRIVKTA